MRAVVWGASGAMGRLLCNLLGEQVVGRVSADGENSSVTDAALLGDLRPDMVIDFSHHTAAQAVCAYAVANRCALVVGTTGHTPEEKAMISQAAESIPVFFSGNMSMGIAILCKLAKQTAAAFPGADIEILEIHHNRKVDAPSGTAKMLFEAMREARPELTMNCGRAGECKRQRSEVGISSLRMGNIVGIHEVHISTGNQTLTLRHEAHDRGMFAEGAVEAAGFLMGKKPGLYNMNHLLEAK